MDSIFDINFFDMQFMYKHNHQAKNFPKTNRCTLANVMNNRTIINAFNCDDSNITNIKMQYCQVITTMESKSLKVEILKLPMIKKLIVADNTLFIVDRFSTVD